MNRTRNQLTVALVAFVLGLLVVVQLRTQQAAPGLSGLSAQELTQLVASLNDRNDQLRQEIAVLQRDLGELSASESRGETSLGQLRADLARLRAWAGLEPVVGPGITVTVSGSVSGHAVIEILNELRNAGAEALAIENVRVVAGTVVEGPVGELLLAGRPLPDPFEIRGIGSPETLTGSLTRAGGVIAQLGLTFPNAVLTVTPVERIELPATVADLVPAHGRPRL